MLAPKSRRALAGTTRANDYCSIKSHGRGESLIAASGELDGPVGSTRRIISRLRISEFYGMISGILRQICEERTVHGVPRELRALGLALASIAVLNLGSV